MDWWLRDDENRNVTNRHRMPSLTSSGERLNCLQNDRYRLFPDSYAVNVDLETPRSMSVETFVSRPMSPNLVWLLQVAGLGRKE